MHDEFLMSRLRQRGDQHSLRSLHIPEPSLIDFCSNDYLGIVKNSLISHRYAGDEDRTGSTGSRLLTGNSSLAEDTEEEISRFHGAASALIFNSGYDANLGLLGCVPQRGDTVLYDQLSHASIRDGIRLSHAHAYPFIHNDLDDLAGKLMRSKGNLFVVTESVFSMDGDLCPLAGLVELCEKYGARLIIDEAHATGVIGDSGEGLVQSCGLQDRIFARVHTFGKACGVHGAVVLGSAVLRSYLVNFARPFIYSTALPPCTVHHIRESYSVFPGMKAERRKLGELAAFFRRAGLPGIEGGGATPIQAVVVPGNRAVRELAERTREANLDVRAILYPTVPEGSERLRVVLHATNTEKELEILLNCLKNRL